MKSSKSSRTNLPHRGRSSRSVEGHGKASSPSLHKKMEENESRSEDQKPGYVSSASVPPSAPAAVTSIAGQESGDLEVMRQRMGEALAHKQQRLEMSASLASEAKKKPQLSKQGSVGAESGELTSSEAVNSGTTSTDSTKTIRAGFDATPGTVRTPSYPFPRMQLRLNRGFSHRSAPSHKPFTLLSPTNEPLPNEASLARSVTEPESSETSTPLGRPSATDLAMQEDLDFPAPDLYDMILMLGSEPGLDMWWANVTEILTEGYGAERASLAVPGDITDLENVPWGQKATFNIYGSDSGGASIPDSSTTSEIDLRQFERRLDAGRGSIDTVVPSSTRPQLQSRHSIAGFPPEPLSQNPKRPSGPVRAISSTSAYREEQQQPIRGPGQRVMNRVSSSQTQVTSESDVSGTRGQMDSSASVSSTLRCFVHRSIRPLEAEPDPLLIRTGVSTLFGKRKPVLLTRAYTDSSSKERSSGSASRTDNRSHSASSTDGIKFGHAPMGPPSSQQMRSFDEYEQPEPSPWSHSPSPSPAARPDPEESPFFVQPASLDEAAFEQDPPVHDYGATANQSLNAIGADMAKSLIHIPLIQPVPTRGPMNTGLHFPIAILSFLSPLNPYPRSLRHSLTHLLPHLASSYLLAGQYSALQERLRGGPSNRHGASFGLGGTFSDEGSELELVAELSGQVAIEKEKNRDQSSQGSGYSPGDRQSVFRESPSGSQTSTPLLEHLGLSSGQILTPGKSGAEMVDNYFSAKRHKGSQNPPTPGPRPSTEESTDQPKKFSEKLSLNPKAFSRKVTNSSSRSPMQPPTPTGGTVLSSTAESDSGDQLSPSTLERPENPFRRHSHQRDSQSRDDREKPLPELISSLMLNAVPLQLFLAKPDTGDLVWTNRKFDAFRSQGEGRVRDPWKNVHPSDRDGLVKLWNEALKSGSQFTHYIRVKRFNSDSDFRWFVFRASTLLSSNGRLLYWIGSFLDVHEQYMKNVEASEREATMARDDKIRALADAIPQVMFEAIEGEGIVFVNQQWHAFSGQSIDDARGFGFARHVHGEDLHKCGMLSPIDAKTTTHSKLTSEQSDSSSSTSSNKTAAPPTRTNFCTPDSSSLERMIRQGSVTVEKDENGRLSYLTEIRLRSKGGEFRWFLVRLVNVDSSILSVGRTSWYGTCTDIEVRKVLERELNSANKKVHSEMESKTKFFANMSHEIRTPLNGILGSMPWLMEWTLDHDQRRTVDTIQNSANNLRELVDNILDVTKVEAGKMTLLPKWFDVRTLCEEVVDTVSSRAIERGLELNYSLDPTVPSTVKGDPFRVRQVLLNLLGNSVKFTEQGEVYVRCHLHESPSNKPADSNIASLAFEVLDTGRGFDEEDFQRLFKQFGQVGGASNHDAGSGLGLFLSKQLVEMHGGELSVESRAGEGSKFSFFIHVEVPPPESQTTSPSLPNRPYTHRHSSSVVSGVRGSNSEIKMPNTALIKVVSPSQGIIQTPGLSRYVGSPGTQSPSAVSSTMSPPIISSDGSGASLRSNSGNVMLASSMSSLVPSPEPVTPRETAFNPSERQIIAEKAMAMLPQIRRTKSDNEGQVLTPEMAHPATYSIIVICPAEYARAAIKQHIEQVVPHQIAVNVTAIPDIGSLLELMSGPASPTFTHVVLDLPASSDIMLFMRQMTKFTASNAPSLVIITDHYQRRDIIEDFTALASTGRRVYLIHKPVKPSVFAMIFDPARLRSLSKERQPSIRSRAGGSRSATSDDFHNMAMQVKSLVGSKGHRVLLVEDSEVNRMVIIRYLRKISLEYETAKNGEEATDLVFSKPFAYYSLIICDIQMPKKNGYEACREIRAWEAEQRTIQQQQGEDTETSSDASSPSASPKSSPVPTKAKLRMSKKSEKKYLPIMALTANAMPEERAAAADAGFTDYLTKPVDFTVLGTMMVSLLDQDTPHVFLRDRPLES